jgi:hypothetical protein
MAPVTANGKQMIRINYLVRFLIICLLPLITLAADAQPDDDTSTSSNKQQAILYLRSVKDLQQSTYWTNIKPEAFLDNLQLDIQHPLMIYEGRGTNFCSYAALSYIPLNKDPLHFAQFMVHLYRDGNATLGSAVFKPSASVRKAAGTLRFKGKLDARPAEQMWFLSLADHFKGYLNIFHHKYKPGGEDGFWASTNYAKFNRMVRQLFHYNVHASGADIIRTGKKNIAAFVADKMKNNVVFLYVNNTYLTRKTHGINKGLPSHFIVVLDIKEVNGLVNITYWDYGGRTLQQVDPSFLKKITFGISYCSPTPTP